MKTFFSFLLIAGLLLSGCTHQREPEGDWSEPATETVMETQSAPVTAETQETVQYPAPQDLVFVAVEDYIPDIQIDLKYATTDNFTGQVIYEFETVYLRYGTVKKLLAVQEDLKQLDLGLMIWDGFRPVRAQYKLWEVCPDARYVANPNTGFSAHNRGNTIDLTLVDSQGKQLLMPTGFDDFSKKADRDYSDCPLEAADNALLLEALMEKHGFTGYKNEWWHFTDVVSYPVEETFQPAS